MNDDLRWELADDMAGNEPDPIEITQEEWLAWGDEMNAAPTEQPSDEEIDVMAERYEINPDCPF